MFLKKSKRILGLDIGTSGVKMVELEESKKGYQLKSFGNSLLPKETIVNGVLKNSSALVTAITNLTGSLKPKTKPDQMEVLLVAAKKSLINEYVEVISEAGLEPVIVDIDSFALGNAYEFNYPDEKVPVVALIDMGAGVININVVKEGKSTFSRDIFMGGNKLSEEIQKQLAVSEEEAENLKKGGELEHVDYDHLDKIIHDISLALAVEIQRSLDLHAASTTEEEVKKIYLTGGASQLPGIKDLIAERVGVSVEFFDSFREIKYNEAQFDPDHIKEIRPIAAVGVGLALRKLAG